LSKEAGAAKATKVTFDQLRNGEVIIIGQLGQPVGAVVQAKAEWLAPVASMIISKSAPTDTFSISAINGVEMPEPLSFSSREVEILPGSDAKHSTRGLQAYRLYETIEFRGIPGAAWNGAESPVATEEEFAVYSRIHVISIMKNE